MGARYELGGLAFMMKKELYNGIMRARLAIARLLILGYPEVKRLRDAPPELVKAFDVLTDMLLHDGGDLKNGIVRTMFKGWWRTRIMLKVRWTNE